MGLPSEKQLQRFADRYPDMDLDMVQFFAGSMITTHDIVVAMESYFNKLGLSRGRFMVMIHLFIENDPNGLSISDVFAQHKVSSPTMTGIIDTLEKEGLIERIKSPTDRRRVNVRITAAGREFMDDFLPRHHANMEVFTSAFNDRDRTTLVRLLKKLHQSIVDGIEGGIETVSRSAS